MSYLLEKFQYLKLKRRINDLCQKLYNSKLVPFFQIYLFFFYHVTQPFYHRYQFSISNK